MKRKVLIKEVHELQKIAGLLKEEELELSDNPLSDRPEKKADQYIKEAVKLLEDNKRTVTSIMSKLEDSTVKELSKDSNKIDEYRATLKDVRSKTEKSIEKYYSIIERYDFFDRPDSVDKLEKLSSDLDLFDIEVSYLVDIIENIKSISKDYTSISKALGWDNED
jgi:hypothetical protein